LIIDRYLVKEVTAPFFLVTGILASIFLAFSLTRFLNDAAGGMLAADEVVKLTLLKLVVALEVLLPIAMYLSILLGLGRLYSDSEMSVLRACGISESRLLRPVIRMAALLAILVGLISTVVRPAAKWAMYDIKAVAKAASELHRVKAGTFFVDSDQNRTVYIERMPKPDQLQNLFISARDEHGLEVISADRGSLHPYVTPVRHRLEMERAHVFRRSVDGPNVVGTFGTLVMSVGASVPQPVGYKTKAEPTLVLGSSADPVDIAEYQWRLSTGLSTLLLALLAVPLSRTQPRKGKYAKLLGAVLIYAVYYNLMGMARTWVEQQRVAEQPGIWWVPAALALVILIFFVPWSWLWPKRKRLASRQPDA